MSDPRISLKVGDLRAAHAGTIVEVAGRQWCKTAGPANVWIPTDWKGSVVDESLSDERMAELRPLWVSDPAPAPRAAAPDLPRLELIAAMAESNDVEGLAALARTLDTENVALQSSWDEMSTEVLQLRSQMTDARSVIDDLRRGLPR